MLVCFFTHNKKSNKKKTIHKLSHDFLAENWIDTVLIRFCLPRIFDGYKYMVTNQ